MKRKFVLMFNVYIDDLDYTIEKVDDTFEGSGFSLVFHSGTEWTIDDLKEADFSREQINLWFIVK